MGPKITITGNVIDIKFSAADSLFKVAIIEDENSKNAITIVGSMIIEVGHKYAFYGNYEMNKKFNEKQFKVESVEMLELDLEGLVYFLSSTRFYGIGEKTAKKIVNGLGENCIDLIKKDPTILSQFNINEDMQKKIQEELLTHKEFSEVFTLLSKYRFTEKNINDIYDYFIAKNVVQVREAILLNPYQIIGNVDFVSLEKIDHLFLDNGGDPESSMRVQAVVVSTINKLCFETGDTYTNNEEIKSQIKKHLTNVYDFNIQKFVELNPQALEKISIIGEKVFPKELYDAECDIALEVKRRIKEVSLRKIDDSRFENNLNIIQEKIGFPYHSDQKQAIKKSLESKISIITGGPGTGKTTVIRGIIEVYKNIEFATDDQIMLCAPTGRAAQRMKESTGINSKTIHSLLEWDPYKDIFAKDSMNMLKQKLFIIDEFSMVDVKLAAALFSAINHQAQIIIVGDKDQLESVAPGQVLNDLIDCELIPLSRLTQVYRQGEGSTIAQLAHQISENLPIECNNTEDISYLNKNNLNDNIKSIVDRAYSAGYNQMDVQILFPMYRGEVGIDRLNEILKPQSSHRGIEKWDKTFHVGDKIMQLKNNPELEISNGDIGEILSINQNRIDETTEALKVKFGPREVSLKMIDIDNITHAYAISIHKSQGSEFPFVILPLVQSSMRMLTKKLLYTAITRASKKLIIIGDITLIEKACNNEARSRNTLLSIILKNDIIKK